MVLRKFRENSKKILRKCKKFSGKALRCNTVPRKLRSPRIIFFEK